MSLRTRRLRLRLTSERYREWRLKRSLNYVASDIFEKMITGDTKKMPKFDGLDSMIEDSKNWPTSGEIGDFVFTGKLPDDAEAPPHNVLYEGGSTGYEEITRETARRIGMRSMRDEAAPTPGVVTVATGWWLSHDWTCPRCFEDYDLSKPEHGDPWTGPCGHRWWFQAASKPRTD